MEPECKVCLDARWVSETIRTGDLLGRAAARS
jgi:hypothetical protein